MGEIMMWCSENEAFVNLIFSASSLLTSTIAIIFSIYIGVLPYKKKVYCLTSIYKREGKLVGEIEIVNTGNRPIRISKVLVLQKGTNLVVGERFKKHIFNLVPGMKKKVHVKIFDLEERIEEQMIDLNDLLYVKIYDTEKKRVFMPELLFSGMRLFIV